MVLMMKNMLVMNPKSKSSKSVFTRQEDGRGLSSPQENPTTAFVVSCRHFPVSLTGLETSPAVNAALPGSSIIAFLNGNKKFDLELERDHLHRLGIPAQRTSKLKVQVIV